jgi:peptidoglycan hydrolase-like protein with peptidoglycan-binding domain
MSLRRPLIAATALATIAGLGAAVPDGTAISAAEAATATPATQVVTPGNFRGYGFDQCNAPSQKAMNAWLKSSPFLAVGIYISGASRACREQANLTPTWVSTQVRKGWRLLPIDLGPQAPCNPRFPRYGSDPVIRSNPGSTGRYPKARHQGAAEAARAVTAAQRLGIAAGSTLWYDLEGFDQTNTRCRNASLAFLSGWTSGLHAQHYVSGVYSSAGSGIWALDNARIKAPDSYTLPDRLWIARWDGKANTSTTYIGNQGWRGGNRVKQYVGGHNETWGGVTINIDRDFLDLGDATQPAVKHCGGVPVDLPDYPRVKAGSRPDLVKALQCLLSEQKAYAGRLTGRYNAKTAAAAKAWQQAHGLPGRAAFNRSSWMTLFAAGPQPVLKFGSSGPAVRRLQRMLNAAVPGTDLPITGVFAEMTDSALRGWQIGLQRRALGVANPSTWRALASGLRS